ncbi:hypothetical protein CYMTET_13036 [Cymbomonas tetramitiformis]|uniref:Uncharacterized protein n=1 Tax=Cymbomonas tetramitiformis TaxID=36881 RepID=A0AAE0LBL0_9CHLO|nr:hypothetical protein CYMTET_13036 [Cymbomonas tetramitiformis]
MHVAVGVARDAPEEMVPQVRAVLQESRKQARRDAGAPRDTTASDTLVCAVRDAVGWCGSIDAGGGGGGTAVDMQGAAGSDDDNAVDGDRARRPLGCGRPPFGPVPRRAAFQGILALSCFCMLGVGAAVCFGAQPDDIPPRRIRRQQLHQGFIRTHPLPAPLVPPTLGGAASSPDYTPESEESGDETENFNTSADPFICNGWVCLYPAIDALT